MAGNVGGGILSGAATGASMGSVVPVWGSLIGGVIGGVAGGIGGALKGKGEQETKEEMDRKFNDALLRLIRQQNIENQRADRELNQRGLDWLAQRRDVVMRR
jgi:phage tail tape-measure protein